MSHFLFKGVKIFKGVFKEILGNLLDTVSTFLSKTYEGKSFLADVLRIIDNKAIDEDFIQTHTEKDLVGIGIPEGVASKLVKQFHTSDVDSIIQNIKSTCTPKQVYLKDPDSMDDMPLVERQSQIDRLSQVVYRNISVMCSPKPSKSAQFIPCLIGGSGIGKTSLADASMDAIRSRWKDSTPPDLRNASVRLYTLDFGNGYRLVPSDYDNKLEIIIGLRLAHTHFMNDHNIAFPSFAANIMGRGVKDLFSLDNVLNAIKNETPAQDLFVSLLIDEVQIIVEEKRFPDLLKDIINLICRYFQKGNIIVQLVIAGTTRKEVLEVKRATEYSLDVINIPLLKKNGVHSILDTYKDLCGSNAIEWRVEYSLVQLINDLGGLPRALEEFIKLVFGSIGANKLEILSKTKAMAFFSNFGILWQHWEQFNASFEAFIVNALIHCGRKLVSLGEIFRGSSGTVETMQIPIQLPATQTTVARLLHRFPVKPLRDPLVGNIQFDSTDNHHILLNAQGASCGDTVSLYKIQPNTDSFEELLVFGQEKFDYKGADFTLDLAKAEHNKNQEAGAEFILERKIKTKIVTVCITTQPFSGVLPHDILVVSRESFSRHYGPLHTNTLFNASRPMNPNYCDVAHLTIVNQVGEEKAIQIVSKRKEPDWRGYKDAEDLCIQNGIKNAAIIKSLQRTATFFPYKSAKLEFP
eukprot:gene11426-13318_t